MAIFKVVLLAALPFIAAPLSSSPPATMDVGAAERGLPAFAVHSRKSHGKSTIYKNQPTPDFLLRPSDEADEETLIFPDYDAVVVENRTYLEV